MTEKSEREQFIERTKQRLDDLNEEIDRLEKRADEIRGDASEKLQARRKELRERRVDLEKRLKQVRAASEAEWEKLKLEAEHAWKAFQNSFNYFKSHFK